MFIFLFAIIFSMNSYASETCSRVAVINYQEILVDTNTSQKGEGLRYHLEKDPIALKHLNIYREGTKTKFINIALGTTGTLLAITGALTNESKETQQLLLISGLATLVLNFALSKILSLRNEHHLTRAIDEYNKRNLPRIDYNPGKLLDRNPSAVTLTYTRIF